MPLNMIFNVAFLASGTLPEFTLKSVTKLTKGDTSSLLKVCEIIKLPSAASTRLSKLTTFLNVSKSLSPFKNRVAACKSLLVAAFGDISKVTLGALPSGTGNLNDSFR